MKPHEFRRILDDCTFPSVKFHFDQRTDGDFRLTSIMKTSDSYTGQKGEFAMGSKLKIEDLLRFDDADALRFIFDRLSAHIQHETAEQFRYRDRMIFNPHVEERVMAAQ